MSDRRQELIFSLYWSLSLPYDDINLYKINKFRGFKEFNGKYSSSLERYTNNKAEYVNAEYNYEKQCYTGKISLNCPDQNYTIIFSANTVRGNGHKGETPHMVIRNHNNEEYNNIKSDGTMNNEIIIANITGGNTLSYYIKNNDEKAKRINKNNSYTGSIFIKC